MADAALLESMKKKLHPGRFSACSPRMAAIIGCIVGEKYTDPQMQSLCVTSDKFVLAMHVGDCGYNDFIGPLSEFRRNWDNLLKAADDLTKEERLEAQRLYREAVRPV